MGSSPYQELQSYLDNHRYDEDMVTIRGSPGNPSSQYDWEMDNDEDDEDSDEEDNEDEDEESKSSHTRSTKREEESHDCGYGNLQRLFVLLSAIHLVHVVVGRF